MHGGALPGDASREHLLTLRQRGADFVARPNAIGLSDGDLNVNPDGVELTDSVERGHGFDALP